MDSTALVAVISQALHTPAGAFALRLIGFLLVDLLLGLMT